MSTVELSKEESAEIAKTMAALHYGAEILISEYLGCKFCNWELIECWDDELLFHADLTLPDGRIIERFDFSKIREFNNEFSEHIGVPL